MTDSNSLKLKSNKKNASDDNENDFIEAKILDSGWGWVEVGASFSINMIADGILNSMGSIERKLGELFEVEKSVSSWVPAVTSGMVLCAGPISSILVKKYGCRTVTIGGSILAAISLFVTYFAINIPTLIVTIGIGFGCGLSLVTFPAMIIVTTHFDKYRSFATGIAVSGTGVGTIIFPKFVDFLIDNYHWNGTCWTLSTIVLIFAICGALFKPLKTSAQRILPMEQLDRYQSDETDEIVLRKKSNNKRKSRTSSDKDNMRSTLSQPSFNTDTKTFKDTELQTEKVSIANENWIISQSRDSFQESLNSLSTQQTQSESTIGLERYGSVQRKNENKEIKSSKIRGGCILANKFRDTLELINFNLLTDPIFALFAVSNFCTSIGFYVPIFCITQHFTKLGRKDEGFVIFMIYAIVNTLGRMVVGFISNKSFVNRLFVYNVGLIICGVACMALTACVEFVAFAVCSAIFGLTISPYVTIRVIVLVDLLGMDKLESTFGLLMLFEGVATFMGPPIVGALHDRYSSYGPGFIFAGLMIAISGTILLPLPKLQQYIEKRQLRCGVDHIENAIAT